MCLIVLSWQTEPDYPLIVAANRDEFYQRPTQPLHPWAGSPVIAGKDLQAGGTWMGLSREGRFAAVTNVRQGTELNRTYPLSRGILCQGFLESKLSPADYLDSLQSQAMEAGGFNLLVSDGKTLGYACNRYGIEQGDAYYDYTPKLEPGLYGLSNHRLDTPWPKVKQSKQRLTDILNRQRHRFASHATYGQRLPESLLLSALLDSNEAQDHELPDTGITSDKERFLSPAFISSSLDYGTRASTILLLDSSDRQTVMEQTWHPGGQKGCRTFFCC